MNAISEAANMVANGVREQTEQLVKLTELLSAQESNVRRLEAENSVLREQLKAATDSKELYKGFTVEIATQLNNVHMIIKDVTERSKQAATVEHEKAMPKAMKMPEDDLPGPAPGFLSKEKEVAVLPKGVRRI